MLAFNLGVFFRNLHGQPVRFSARNPDAELTFLGGVKSLQEKTDLAHQLSVVLAEGDLSLHITFDEGDDEENADNPDVHITLARQGQEAPLFQTRFAFDEIHLQPVEEGKAGKDKR